MGLEVGVLTAKRTPPLPRPSSRRCAGREPGDPMPPPPSRTRAPAGVLGENLVIPGYLTQSVRAFYILNAIALSCCFIIFYSIVLYMRWRHLI